VDEGEAAMRSGSVADPPVRSFTHSPEEKARWASLSDEQREEEARALFDQHDEAIKDAERESRLVVQVAWMKAHFADDSRRMREAPSGGSIADHVAQMRGRFDEQTRRMLAMVRAAASDRRLAFRRRPMSHPVSRAPRLRRRRIVRSGQSPGRRSGSDDDPEPVGRAETARQVGQHGPQAESERLSVLSLSLQTGRAHKADLAALRERVEATPAADGAFDYLPRSEALRATTHLEAA
jgi:hypothetical protein